MSARRCLVLGLFLLGIAMLVAPGEAQQFRSINDLEKDYNRRAADLNKFVSGDKKLEAGDKEYLESVAQYFVYRFTDNPPQANNMAKFQKEFELFVNRVESEPNRKGNREFVKALSPVMVAKFRELLDQDFDSFKFPIINAAPMLPQLARFQQEPIADYLVELLQDHDKGASPVKAVPDEKAVAPEEEKPAPKDDKKAGAKEEKKAASSDDKKAEAKDDKKDDKKDEKKAAAKDDKKDEKKAVAKDDKKGAKKVETKKGEAKKAEAKKAPPPLKAANGSTKNKHDIVKMYAARGLREFFPLRGLTDNDDPPGEKLLQRKAKEVKYVEGLVALVERAPPAKLAAEEADAIRFIRREAVESLAQAQVPAASTWKGAGQIEGPVAPTLLRVLAGAIDPEPGLPERVEAAIGVCQIKYRFFPDYHPELGTYLVGKLLHDFFNAYNTDLPNLKGGTKRPAQMHWRIHSRRLDAALKEMAANAKVRSVDKESPEEALAKQLGRDALPFLKLMQDQQLRQIPQDQLRQFRDTVNKMRPKTNTAFKTLKSTPIDLDRNANAQEADPDAN
jgi:hypothetical protein